jgi:hypothetical protein
MTGEKKMFTPCDMIENPTERIAFGGNGGEIVVDLGKISISINHSIFYVYLVESLDYNLLSVSQLCEMGYNCLLTNGGVTVFRRGDDSVPLRVNSREGFTWWISHRIKPNLIHAYWQSLS